MHCGVRHVRQANAYFTARLFRVTQSYSGVCSQRRAWLESTFTVSGFLQVITFEHLVVAALKTALTAAGVPPGPKATDRDRFGPAADRCSVVGRLWNPHIHLGIEYDALLRCRFIAGGDANGRLGTAIHAYMKHIRRDVDVVPGPRHLPMLQPIACPHFDLAADHVKCGLVALMNMCPRSLAWGNGNDSEEESFGADSFGTDARIVIGTLF
jgi:hypothetical protein